MITTFLLNQAMQKALTRSLEPQLLKEYFDYLGQRIQIHEVEKDDLEAYLVNVGEAWQDKVSIERYHDLAGWYEEDTSRYTYADEALMDIGERGRILEAMRVGYCYYLAEQVTNPLSAAILTQ